MSKENRITKSSTDEDDEDESEAALNLALSLRKKQKQKPFVKQTTESVPTSKEKSKSAKKTDSNDSEEQPAAIYGRFLPSLAPLQSQFATESNPVDGLNSNPHTKDPILPPKPEACSSNSYKSNQSTLPKLPDLLQETDDDLYFPGTRIKIPPAELERQLVRRLQEQQKKSSKTSSKTISKNNNINTQNKKAKKNNNNPNQAQPLPKPRGLLSTDEEVKTFAVSGRIVEVNLGSSKANKIPQSNTSHQGLQNTHNKTSNPNAPSGLNEYTKPDHMISRISGIQKGPLPNSTKRNNSKEKNKELEGIVESILKEASQINLAPSLQPLQHRSFRRLDDSRNAGPSSASSYTPELLREEEKKQKARIEQARKMHDDIERSMRLRDQRGNNRRGGYKKYNNNNKNTQQRRTTTNNNTKTSNYSAKK